MRAKASILALVVVAALETPGRADIFRWDNRQAIPGTEGITPGPGVKLEYWNTLQQNLRYGDFSTGVNLTGASFKDSLLENSRFRGANLTNASLARASLSGVDLSDAVIRNADFSDTTARGFRRQQLYSTASYKAQDLRGVVLSANDLSNADFGLQTLTNAVFRSANLSDASLDQADLQNVDFSGASLVQANLRGANLSGAVFGVRNEGDIAAFFASTTNLTSADMTDATIAGATFGYRLYSGFTHQQLYSTASYKTRHLERISFIRSYLAGSDLSYQNLSDASFFLTDFYDIISVPTGPSKHLTVNLYQANLTRANFVGHLTFTLFDNANLAGATFVDGAIFGSSFVGSNLKNAVFDSVFLENTFSTPNDPDNPIFIPDTKYSQWTVFPADFDPVANGLVFEQAMDGDFDGNDQLELWDVDRLSLAIRGTPDKYRPLLFDVTQDQKTELSDLQSWVHGIKHTWFGDANLDLAFNSADLVAVFQTGEYEDDLPLNSGWNDGDWNADGDFTSSDIVTAFQDGGYERGSRAAVVPEPSMSLPAFVAMSAALSRRRRGLVS